jgi:CO/xanthine dehydrogenase Mo-binding subunit
VPPIRVEFLEAPYPHGAGGAKGIGELPFDGVAPAVANALAAAGAGDPCTIPLTPERVMDLVMGSSPRDEDSP